MLKFSLLASAGLSAALVAQPIAAQEAAQEAIQEENTIRFIGRERPGLVVTATRNRYLLYTEDALNAVTVIEKSQIDERQVRDVADVLRDVPGVAVSSVAGQTQIRLRGTEANHVLVLVDGIEVSDPGSGEFDFGTLQAELGSSVEVLRGPQSALYGNDAIGGVVAYRSGDFNGVAGRVEAGTKDTFNGAARFGIDKGDFAASLSAASVTTNGEPNARPVNGGGTRDIGRDSYTVSGKLRGEVADNFTLRAVGRFVDTSGDSNNQDFAFGSPTLGLAIDSPGVGFENTALYGLLGAQFDTMDGAIIHDVSIQFADLERNTFNPAGRTSDTASDRFKASYVSSYNFNASDHTLTFAADYEVEGFNNIATFDERREVENAGLVGEYRYDGNIFNVSAAIRQDFNDRFQDTTTFRVGAGVDVTDTTRLRASIGTGVKNPTFFELFGFFDGVFVGNADLEPEESTSWEVGVDQRLFNDQATVSVTYFNAELEGEIFTTFLPPTFVATPGNRDTKSEQQGVELALSAIFSRNWSLNAAYSYLDAEENGVTEVRRPESIASAALTWTSTDDTASATLVVRHNGEMLDNDFTTGAFPAPLTTLDDFTLVNINARYEVAEGINLFARTENLFDETYEQVNSFVSPGRTVIAGIEARF